MTIDQLKATALDAVLALARAAAVAGDEHTHQIDLLKARVRELEEEVSTLRHRAEQVGVQLAIIESEVDRA